MRATIFLRTVITLDGEYTLVRVDIQKSDGAASRRRDKFVAGALGVKKYHKVKYQTVAQRLTGLLPPGSKGVNHGMTPQSSMRRHLFIGLRQAYRPMASQFSLQSRLYDETQEQVQWTASHMISAT